GAQPVQPYALVLAVGPAGADGDPGKADDAVDGVRRDVYRTHPVARDRKLPALHESPAHLDVVRRDPVGRREPAQHARGADDAEAGQAPPVVAARTAGDEDPGDRQQRARNLLDRMYQEHARAEPAPGRVDLTGFRGLLVQP